MSSPPKRGSPTRARTRSRAGTATAAPVVRRKRASTSAARQQQAAAAAVASASAADSGVSAKGTRASRSRTAALRQPRMSFGGNDLGGLAMRAEAARAALALQKARDLERRRAARVRSSIKRRSLALMDRAKWDPGEEARALIALAVAEGDEEGEESSEEEEEEEDDDDEEEAEAPEPAAAPAAVQEEEEEEEETRAKAEAEVEAPPAVVEAKVEPEPAAAAAASAAAPAATPLAEPTPDPTPKPSAASVQRQREEWDRQQAEIERLEAEEEAAEMAELERLEREIEEEERRMRAEMAAAEEADRLRLKREQYMLALREHLQIRELPSLGDVEVQAGVPVVFSVPADSDEAPDVRYDGTAQVSTSFVALPDGRRRSVVTMMMEPANLLDPAEYGDRTIEVLVGGARVEGGRVRLRPARGVTPAATYAVRHSRTDELVPGARMRLVRVSPADGAEELEDATAAHVRGENPFRVEGELPDGRYRAEFSADGFYATSQDLCSVGNARRAGDEAEKVTLQPEITSATEVVCVLRWAAHPRDLDLHVYDVDDSSGMHIYFSHKEAPGMSLDIDKTDGHGPETATLDVRPGRGFCVFVLNFSPKDGHVALSEATVDIYSRARSFRVRVPNDVSLPKARYWDVMRIYNPAKASRADVRFDVVGRVVPSQPGPDAP